MTRLPHTLPLALRAVAFWAAVVLPLAYVPVMFGRVEPPLALVLIGVHVGCLFVGHDYTPGTGSISPTNR